MNKRITQLNAIELKDGLRVGVTYSTYREDGVLYSNNSKISYKADEEMKKKVDELYEYLLNKMNG
nr:MAG TPA: hypothetical protein [Caudoviricetes sp.]